MSRISQQIPFFESELEDVQESVQGSGTLSSDIPVVGLYDTHGLGGEGIPYPVVHLMFLSEHSVFVGS